MKFLDVFVGTKRTDYGSKEPLLAPVRVGVLIYRESISSIELF